MKIRLARASKFNPFTAPGLLFAADDGGGGGDAATQAAAAQSAADQKVADDAKNEDDPAAKLEAAQKVNADLERKLKRSDDNRTKVSELTATLSALQAKVDGKEVEHAADQVKREAEIAALTKANERIVRSEVKTAAKGVLADPADAFKFLNLSKFDVNDDGEVNEAAIADAIADLIKNKPYLAVQDGKRFQGGGDGGTRKESRPAQLTKANLAGMSPQAIEEARIAGRLDDLMQGKLS